MASGAAAGDGGDEVRNNPFLMTPVYATPSSMAATTIMVASANAVREESLIFKYVRYVCMVLPIGSKNDVPTRGES